MEYFLTILKLMFMYSTNVDICTNIRNFFQVTDYQSYLLMKDSLFKNLNDNRDLKCNLLNEINTTK